MTDENTYVTEVDGAAQFDGAADQVTERMLTDVDVFELLETALAEPNETFERASTSLFTLAAGIDGHLANGVDKVRLAGKVASLVANQAIESHQHDSARAVIEHLADQLGVALVHLALLRNDGPDSIDGE